MTLLQEIVSYTYMYMYLVNISLEKIVCVKIKLLGNTKAIFIGLISTLGVK